LTLEGTRDLKLDFSLCDAAEKRFGARFGGLEPFLNSVLKELVREDSAQMDQSEQSIVEQRLKDLGYI
jgi:hypothetical protein